jgi:hypothetical protein
MKSVVTNITIKPIPIHSNKLFGDMNVLELEVRPRRKRAEKRSREIDEDTFTFKRRRGRKPKIAQAPADCVPTWDEVRQKSQAVKDQLKDDFESETAGIQRRITALELTLQYTRTPVQRQKVLIQIRALKERLSPQRLEDRFKYIDETATKVERTIAANLALTKGPNASKQDRRIVRSVEIEKTHNVTEELSRSGRVPQTELERKRDLMDRFVMKINPQAAPPIYVLHADFCDDCGVSMRIIAKDSLLGCPKCHKVRVFLQSANSVSAQTLQSDSASGTGTATGTGTASSSNVFTSASSWWDLRRSVFSSFINVTGTPTTNQLRRHIFDHDKLNPTKTWMEQSYKHTSPPTSDSIVPSVHSSMHEEAMMTRLNDLEGHGKIFETFDVTARAWFNVLVQNMPEVQVQSFD